MSRDSIEVVMGIDPGLGTTGWGIVRLKGGRLTYVDSGRIRTRPTQTAGQRLTKLFLELQRVVEAHQVTHGAVESGYVGRSPLAALALGEARATAILAVATSRIPVESYAPRQVKMAVTGRGAAAKEQVSYMVGKMLRLEFDSGENDISDALAVAICCSLNRERSLAATRS